jgi:hypothetical protein
MPKRLITVSQNLNELAEHHHDHLPIKKSQFNFDIPNPRTTPLLWSSDSSIEEEDDDDDEEDDIINDDDETLNKYHNESNSDNESEKEENHQDRLSHFKAETNNNPIQPTALSIRSVPRTGSFVNELSQRLAQCEKKGEPVSQIIPAASSICMRSSQTAATAEPSTPRTIEEVEEEEKSRIDPPSSPILTQSTPQSLQASQPLGNKLLELPEAMSMHNISPSSSSNNNYSINGYYHHHNSHNQYQHHNHSTNDRRSAPSVPNSTSSPSLTIPSVIKRSTTGTSIASLSTQSSMSTTTISNRSTVSKRTWHYSHFSQWFAPPPLSLPNNNSPSSTSMIVLGHNSGNDNNSSNVTLASSTRTCTNKRARVIQELLFTEKSYQADMELVYEIYYGPSFETFSKSEIKQIFINLLDIIAFEKEFVAGLETACNHDLIISEESNGKENDTTSSTIGTLFNKMVRN